MCPDRGSEIWKLSADPEFIAKVLAVDEKSQIQALDRTAPCLPILATPLRTLGCVAIKRSRSVVYQVGLGSRTIGRTIGRDGRDRSTNEKYRAPWPRRGYDPEATRKGYEDETAR
jgi:hypothetical protein